MSTGLQRQNTTDMSDEDIHDVLRNRRRRLVIEILQQDGGEFSVRELSERIGATESEQDPPPRDVKQSVYVSLLQTHLPKLDDHGIIDYQSEGKTVRMDSGMEELSIYLETVPKWGLSRSEYYAWLSLLGLLTVLGSHTGTPFLSAVPPLTLAYAFFGLLFLSGVYHSYQQGSSIVQRLRE